MIWLVFCANFLALRIQKVVMHQIVAWIAGRSGLNHPLTWSFGEISRKGKKMAKTEGVEIVIKHKDLAPEPCEYCGSTLVFHEKQENKEGENEK